VTARILAVDTTAEFGSLALVENGMAVEEVLLHSPDGFGHVLFGQIEQLLERNGWSVDSIDVFASASGPGSFTGVRVGLAAVKGLAEAVSKPVVAVSNLQALASFGSQPLRATVLDARRGEVYGAVYDSALRIVAEERVLKFGAWLDHLPEGELEFVAVNFAPFIPAVAGTRFETTPVVEAPRALAAAIGKIAALRLAAGEACDPAAVDANYVRRSDAELLWKDR
jgi:tRNA threonylcarbamoyladenosine biosynthesis protein TsaB